MSDRVIVFLDYLERKDTREAFHEHREPDWNGQIDPVRLAKYLTADSPFDRMLSGMRIYHGCQCWDGCTVAGARPTR